VDIQHRAHSTLTPISGSTWEKHNPGVSCITPMSEEGSQLSFFTGGFDKRVMLWTIQTNSNRGTSREIGGKDLHCGRVSALAWCSDRSALMSGASTRFRTTWIEQNKFEEVKLASPILQIHQYELEDRHKALGRSHSHTLQSQVGLEVGRILYAATRCAKDHVR
jgi:WD40 repeat protein